MAATVLNRRSSEFEKKMMDISSLVTTNALNTKINKAENKIPDHAKYITTQEFNQLTANSLAARLT